MDGAIKDFTLHPYLPFSVRLHVALKSRIENGTSIIYASKDRCSLCSFRDAFAKKKKKETLGESVATESKYILKYNLYI